MQLCYESFPSLQCTNTHHDSSRLEDFKKLDAVSSFLVLVLGSSHLFQRFLNQQLFFIKTASYPGSPGNQLSSSRHMKVPEMVLTIYLYCIHQLLSQRVISILHILNQNTITFIYYYLGVIISRPFYLRTLTPNFSVTFFDIHYFIPPFLLISNI